MSKATTTSSSRVTIVAMTLVGVCAGLGAGLRWHGPILRALGGEVRGDSSAPGTAADAAPTDKQLWTCGMHPQVIQDHPGDCPICHMKLTPLVTSGSGGLGASAGVAGTVVIDPAMVQNMGVRTAEVTQGALRRHARAMAVVIEPEPGRADINLRVSGWIEKLHADTEGMSVAKGEPLFEVYSPELERAIEELIAAHKSMAPASVGTEASGGTSASELIAAARQRLRTLGLSESQIEEFGAMERAPATVTYRSPLDGVVVEKAMAYNGAAVQAGQTVMRLSDRSHMWVEARVPEGVLGGVRVGQHGTVRLDGMAGMPIEGEVVFVHPNLDDMTRTGLVRMVVPNPQGRLRAGMYAVAEIAMDTSGDVTMIPREAIIDSGESRVVFVSMGKGKYEPRRVEVGATGDGGMVQVVAGLEPGEVVVTSGQFLLDSESRLREAIAKFLGTSSGESEGTASTDEDHRTTAAAKGDAAAPARLIDRVVAEYLAIAEPFGEEEPGTPPAKLEPLIAALVALGESATGSDAKRLIGAARVAADAMKDQSTDRQREQLKRLSAATIAIVDVMPPSEELASSLYVATCPMAKADWLQRSDALANPYYAEDMKECGGILRRVGKAPAGERRDTP